MEFTIRNKTYKISKFYVFILGFTIIKLFAMGLFSSDYQDKMFIPFITQFLNGIGTKDWNVYEYYYVHKLIPSFPYPPFMLFIESIFGSLLSVISIKYIFIKNLIFKMPILLFDLLGMYFLINLFPEKRKYVGVLYYASPIVFFACYMHGQLDVIPTTLLLGSFYFLLKKKRYHYQISILFLSASLLTKLHILAVLPIIFIYLIRCGGIVLASSYMVGTLGITTIGILPFLSKGFIKSVLFNAEQSVITDVFWNLDSARIYIPIFAVLLIYIIVFNIQHINKQLLLSLCGITFSIFLALCPPMPGWYVWIVPFVAIHFILVDENRLKNGILYLILNGAYIFYFVLGHQTEYIDLYFLNQSLQFLKLNNQVIINVLFTLLAALLFYIIFQMYQSGIASNSLYKRKGIPFTIGIAGDSGTGKSTFIKTIKTCVGIENLLEIEGDGDHKWERGEKMWEQYTHLNPKANYLYRQAMDMERLRIGSTTRRVEYDHSSGKFTLPKRIKPKPYILLCGLHALYLPQMRKNLDLKIYMDSDETLRRYWKIQRDVAHRGYSKEKILKQIEDRIPDAQKYIYPQKQYADLIVQYFDKNLKNCLVEYHEVCMSMRLSLKSEINIEPLLSRLQSYGISIFSDFNQDLERQTIVCDGESLKNKSIPFKKIASDIIPQLEEISEQSLEELDPLQGILCLFLLLLISYSMQGGR